MLSFAAFLPHTPLLLTTVGKELSQNFQKTKEKIEEVRALLEKSLSDSIIIISGHQAPTQSSFLSASEFTGNLERYGDFVSKANFKGSLGLTQAIKSGLETKIPVSVISENNLDASLFVPLFLLNAKPEINILPLRIGEMADLAYVIRLSKMMRETIINLPERIAVIAGGELSHPANVKEISLTLEKSSSIFLNRIREAIMKRDIEYFLKLPPIDLEKDACGLKPLLFTLGVLGKSQASLKIHAQESPLGIACITLSFYI